MFWDSSAIVPPLVAEGRSRPVMALLRADPMLALWWGTPLECHSALYRRHREDVLPLVQLRQALGRLGVLLDDADVITPADRVRARAERLVATHPLRAADALQLAAALTWCYETPRGATFVCLDDRLRAAAHREGFKVLPA